MKACSNVSRTNSSLLICFCFFSLLHYSNGQSISLDAQPTDSKSYQYGVWMGIARNWGLAGQEERIFFPLFGIDFKLKNSETYLGLLFSPMGTPKSSNYSDLEKRGLSGEIGFTFQQFSKGRFTGRVSKAYYGFDLRYGWQKYSYSPIYQNPSTARNQYNANWFDLLARVGYRFRFERFFVDIAVPIGLQFGHISSQGQYSRYNYRQTNLIVLPAFSAGFRF